MVRKAAGSLKYGWVGLPAMAVVALGFFLGGLLVATEAGWIGVSEAQSAAPMSQQEVNTSGKTASFAELVKKLAPSVVNIKVTKVARVGGGAWPESQEGPFGEFFKRFFEDMPHSRRQYKQDGAGSGVIISDDGYIMTNNHVVEGAEQLTVTLADSREFEAKLVGRDSKTDLAVVKIDASVALPAALMGDSEALQVGDWVLAIGNPFGLGHTVTSGIVSAKGRIIGAGPYDDFIQTDASINPGNSGGPLFNMRGEVVGINTAILPYGRGIGFAIPINTAKPLIPQMVKTGTVSRGYLGIMIQPVTPELAAALDLTESKGALVSDVASGSPADKAGIQRGDVVLSYNSEVIDTVRDLPLKVAQTPVGEKAQLVVLRNGKEERREVTVGRFPSDDEKIEQTETPAQEHWGLELRNITPEMARSYNLDTGQGVIVVGVQPDSPAEQAGVHRGDILLEVNRQAVSSVDEVKEKLSRSDNKKSLLLLVQRQQRNLFVALAK